MALKMPLELVLNFDGTVRRVHIVVEPTFACVLETIRMAYPNLNMDMFTLKYVDDDGDLCTLVDATFTDFLRCLPSKPAGSQGVLFLEPSPELTAHQSLLEPQEDPWWDFHGKTKGADICLDEPWEYHHKGKGKAKGKGFEEWWHGPEGLWWEAHGKVGEKGKGKWKGKDFEELWEDFHGKGEEKGKGKGKHAFEEELWAFKGKGKGRKGEDLEEWWHGPEEPWWEHHGKGAEKGKGKCKGKGFEEWWHGPEMPWWEAHGKGADKGKGKHKGKDFEDLWDDFRSTGEEEQGKGKGKHAFEEELWALKSKGKGQKGEHSQGWWHGPEEPWWEPHGKGAEKGKCKCKGKDFEECWEDFHAKGKTKGKGKGKFAFEEELWEVKGKGKLKGAFKGKGKGPWLFDGEEPWEEHDHDAWVHPSWDEHGKGKKGKKGKQGKGKKGKAFGQSLEEDDWFLEMGATDGWWMDTSGNAPQESEMTALQCIEEEGLNRQSQHHQPSSL